MSDYDSDSSKSSYASDDEYRATAAAAKKKANIASKNANVTKAASAASASKSKNLEEGAAVESDAEDEDDDSSIADGDSAAADDSAAEDDDESAIDDDDEPFNEDGEDDEQPAVGRNIPARFELNEDENDDEDEDDYMEKFDVKTRKNIIQQYYPELIEQSYEEIEVLTKIIRDKDGFIVDPLHTTLPILSKYEKTRILGERARQLGTGAPSLIEIDEDIIDPYLIALKELDAKKIPFIIKRPIPNGSVEYWKIADLEVI